MVKLATEGSNQTPKIGVPFISMDVANIGTYTLENATKIGIELERVSKCDTSNAPSDLIINYFLNPRSEALYVIPEVYVSLVVKDELQNGYIPIDNNGEHYGVCKYAQETLDKNIIDGSGCEIYDDENNRLYIYNEASLILAEKQCILAIRTNNPSFNSVAAEIVYHADMAIRNWELMQNSSEKLIAGSLYERLYHSALKADLSVDDKGKPEKSYKSYNGQYVIEQRAIWGDR